MTLMKHKTILSLALLAAIVAGSALTGSLLADDKSAKTADEKGEAVFDGKTLDGWDGNPKFWSVQDGAITGKTTQENPTPGNTFIIWKGGEIGDFELHLKYRIEGGNSGIQYRSKVINKEGWGVGGYQADFEAGDGYNGIVYDEGGVAGGRGIMSNRGERTTHTSDGQKKTEPLAKTADELAKLIKKGEWNDYVVIAKGNHLTHKINGEVFTELIDESDKALKSGILAFQVHAGPPMTVQFKDIHLKKLGDGEKK